MKRFVLIFYIIVFIQTLGFAIESHITDSQRVDSISVKYEVCGNDTVFYKKYSIYRTTTICGLKKYEEDFFSKYHEEYNQIDFESLIRKFNKDIKNRTAFNRQVIRKFLESYGKERCAEILQSYNEKSFVLSIFISIDPNGNIIDLNFCYHPSFAKFMTCNDIIRVTNMLENSTQTSLFAEYTKIGVRILPLQSIDVFERDIKKFLEEEATGE